MKIEVDLKKSFLFTVLALAVLVTGIFLINAHNEMFNNEPANAASFGHSADEVVVRTSEVPVVIQTIQHVFNFEEIRTCSGFNRKIIWDSTNNRLRCATDVNTMCNVAGRCSQVCIGSDCRDSWPAGGSGGGGGGVTGTGTVNYLPRWTTTTNLGNSVVYQDSAGNIGIGTTSPVGRLYVNGMITSTNGFCIGTSCINSWPTGSGGGITSLNAGNGISITNPSGPTPTIAVAVESGKGIVNTWGTSTTGYRIGLRGDCSVGEVLKWTGGNWECRPDVTGAGLALSGPFNLVLTANNDQQLNLGIHSFCYLNKVQFKTRSHDPPAGLQLCRVYYDTLLNQWILHAKSQSTGSTGGRDVNCEAYCIN